MQTLEQNSIVACGSSWRLILALPSLLALMVPAVAVTDAFAGHAIAPESQVDWRTHLTTVDDAVGLGGFKKAAEVKARTIYLAALFRARQEASLDGVLRAAEAFAELGDAPVVEQCLKLARPLAAETRDARADRRLRVFAERWEARRLEVEHQNELGREGNVR